MDSGDGGTYIVVFTPDSLKTTPHYNILGMIDGSSGFSPCFLSESLRAAPGLSGWVLRSRGNSH